MDSLDAALQAQLGSHHVKAVARLYQIVYGRPADIGGLRSYVEHLQGGMSLRDIVATFLASSEFTEKLGECSPATLLRRHAGEPGGPADASPSDLALELLYSPTVIHRMPVLASLFPNGVPVERAGDYRLWLALRPDAVRSQPVKASVIVAMQGEPSPWFGETCQSILAAESSSLELLVASRRLNAERRAALRRERADGPHVKFVYAPLAIGFAGLFNAALRRARSDFTGLLVPGDRVDARSMDAVATVCSRADIVLSDEDRLDAEGLRDAPALAGGWDLDQVLAAGHPGFILIRTSVLRAIGGMRRAGLRDMLLRAGQHAGRDKIAHVPQVLLSRRAPAGVWANEAVRPGLTDVRFTEAYLAATGSPACVATVAGSTLRVAYPLPNTPPLVSIVVATRDRAPLLKRCTDGLLQRTEYPRVEVVIVDNGSAEPEATALLHDLAADPHIKILSQPGPFNWAALNNAGVAASTGQVVVLLNNDIDVIEPGWLRELVSQALRPDVGAVGAKLLYPDGRIQHAGVILSDDDHALHRWRFWPGDQPGYQDSLVITREVVAVTGACLAIRRDVYDAVGGCDAVDLPVTWNDVDLCMKVRARGLRVIWTPYARLLHLEQATRGSDDLPENQARFLREQAIMKARWGAALRDDPFRIANLYPDEEGRRLAIR